MRTLQPNFAGGILSEGMLARGDIVKYQVGVADALNVFVRQQGGLANRPGAMLAAGGDVTGGEGTPTPTLVPFQFSADEAYVLEFYEGCFRVLLDGAYVLDSTRSNRAVTAVGVGADPVWSVDWSGIVVGDMVYLTAPAGNWLNGQVARVTALPTGGVKLVLADGLPLTRAEGEISLTGLKLSRVYTVPSPYTAVHARQVRYAQDADYIYMTHQAYPPHRFRRIGHDNWVGEPLAFGPGIGAPLVGPYLRDITSAPSVVDPLITAPGHGFSTGQGVTLRDVTLPWPGNRALIVGAVPSSDTLRLRTLDNQPFDASTFPALPAGAKLGSNGGAHQISGEPGSIDNSVTERYRVSAVTEGGEEGPAGDVVNIYIDLSFKGNRAVVLWRPLPGAYRYVVYRESGGVYGYIGSTAATYFIDNNIAPDTSQGPQVVRIPFVGAGNYPAVVAFHEQRLFMGGTINDPQLVEASQTTNPLNFAVSVPPRDSDAIRFRPKHKQINAIRALVSGVSLMVMTSGGEWALSGGGEDGRPLTPNNLYLRPVSYWGSDKVEPALIGDVMLMLQRGGRVARDYRVGGDRPTDLTIMASDLFREATITGWAYTQTPNSILWVVLSDGGLLSMTYNAEHDIWGWTRHMLGGGAAKVLQVVSVLEGAEDALYLIVRRTVAGRRIVQTERLATRWDRDETKGVYLDAARTILFDTPVSTVKGLVHLVGSTVTALVDGNVYHGLTVGPQGEVTIGARTGTNWVVGHPYRSRIRTLPVEEEVQGEGSTMGELRRPVRASVLVERSRGLWVGDADERVVQQKEWTETDAQRIPLRTTVHTVDFLGDWDTRPSILIEQRDPLPMTVLAVAPDWQFDG